MRIIPFVLLFITIQINIYAQDILNIQANIGPSFSVGKFSSDNIQDSSSGFAGIGGIINLHVGLKPSKNFGLCFYGALAMYPAKTSTIETEINQLNGTNLKANANYYRFGLATGGFMFSGRIADFFVLDARLTAGYLWSETPSIEMKDENFLYYKHYRTPGGGIGANAAFGFRYIVKKVFYVNATADFIFGYPKFENSIIEQRIGTENITKQASYYQWIGAINLTAGLGLSF